MATESNVLSMGRENQKAILSPANWVLLVEIKEEEEEEERILKYVLHTDIIRLKTKGKEKMEQD